MKNFFLIAMLSLTLVSWNKQKELNNPTTLSIQDYDYDNTGKNIRNRNPSQDYDNTRKNIRDRDQSQDYNYDNTGKNIRDRDQSQEYDYDNTGRNIRDRDPMAKTPWDQSESTTDRTITKRIRQAIMSDGLLSTNAKNIKIITIKGVVTLRGPVASSEEKDAIARKVNEIDGIAEVNNQLEVTNKYESSKNNY